MLTPHTNPWTLLAGCLLLVCPAGAESAAPRDSALKIEVTSRRPDLTRPWAKRSPSKSSGSGVMISGGRVLTNAHVVRFASQIEVQPSGSSSKLAARLVATAPSIDLALLELEDASAAEGIPALEIETELPQLRQEVTVMGYPMGGDDLSITQGIVSRIEFTQYYYEAMGLRIQIDAALNSGNSGGPAVSDGRLIGLVFSKIEEADNIGYLIPSEEILEFLSDIEDGSYQGKADTAGLIHTQRLESPTLRRRLGIDNGTTGIMVRSTERAPEDGLRAWDVITHVGPHNIDNQGFVRVNDWLRLASNYYFNKLATDEGIPLTIVRDGEEIEIHSAIERGDQSVFVPLQNEYPDYFIWGPMVFTPATQEMLYGGRDKMLSYLRMYESPLLGRLNDRRRFEGEQIVLTPTRLFPHRTTRGYENIWMANVSHVNDQEVKNLAHLVELLRDASGEYVEFTLGGRHPKLVFDREEAEEATEEILSDEGIRRRGSKAMLKLWNAETEDAS